MVIILIACFVIITILLVLIVIYHETRHRDVKESNRHGMIKSFGSVLIPLSIVCISYFLFDANKGVTKERGVKGNVEATELYYENEEYAYRLHFGFSLILMLVFLFYFDRKNRTIKSIVVLVIICIFFYYVSFAFLPSPKNFIWLN